MTHSFPTRLSSDLGLPWRSISAKLLALTGVPALLAIVCFAVIRYLLSMLYSMRKVWPLPFDQFSVTDVVGVSLLPLGVQTVAGPGASTPCTAQPRLAKYEELLPGGPNRATGGEPCST